VSVTPGSAGILPAPCHLKCAQIASLNWPANAGAPGVTDTLCRPEWSGSL